jgi:hypothetical protein
MISLRHLMVNCKFAVSLLGFSCQFAACLPREYLTASMRHQTFWICHAFAVIASHDKYATSDILNFPWVFRDSTISARSWQSRRKFEANSQQTRSKFAENSRQIYHEFAVKELSLQTCGKLKMSNTATLTRLKPTSSWTFSTANLASNWLIPYSESL